MSTEAARRSRQERMKAAQRQATRRRRITVVAWATGLVVVAALVAAMMITSVPESSSTAKPAPDFTLTDTSGATVSLEDFEGDNVLLYFSEGAGCQSCLFQMAEIENRAAAFARRDVTVLPIVMNPRGQILDDMAANGVNTAFLLDDGTVSQAYGTLGKGMHAGLPGHSFVLIDKTGQQRWYGEFPSMWLPPHDLLEHLDRHLPD